MDLARLRALRLRHHRLTAPARTVSDAARHLLCVQSQDYWGGRLAIATRTRGGTASQVDAAYDRGELVRAWTQRGTLHTIAARDLRGVLAVTAERTIAQTATRRAQLGLDDATIARAREAIVSALRGGGALTRAEALALWEAAGIPTAAGRGYHLLFHIALRGVICWGPTVRRDGLEPREQRLVLVDEWIPAHESPADPLVEMFARYVEGHGPASPEDFAWWAGVTKGDARRAAAGAAERLATIEADDATLFVSTSPPRRSPAAPSTHALPTFEEYYIAYADRSRVAGFDVMAAAGPGANGMVRSLLVHEGEVVGLWKPPPPTQRASAEPTFELLRPAPEEAIHAALERAMTVLRG
ncbi:winged helix DNA-binding domain-containing protein [Microbacterium sediminis]|uniref:winged helix DNA-binding domain-containing protein n=1 Tax=Microbacterium sediminis TaxID=904291 RepID=UPI001072629D|nr:winged helix DNA-binding domain-containing protein [Microbacterium sediminis]QBR73593.1 winged helix DNA-binding domain-containing protein [Microbacterium sediminis]